MENSEKIFLDSNDHQNNQRRFSGVAHLYGNEGLHKFKQSHLLVIGIGGVGSWVAEALARNAIGKLTLIDMDIVAESNINRQLPALTSTLGRNKIDVMKERILDINADCEVMTVDEYITLDNLQQLITSEADFVVDCIDNSRIKAALIASCKRRKIPVITLGGAGGQIDPTLIRIADLSRTQHDPLLSKTRKLLRKEYGFTNNIKRRFAVPCVYSSEHMSLMLPDNTEKTRPNQPTGKTETGLTCAGGIGSSVMVTATFGFVATSYVLKKLLPT